MNSIVLVLLLCTGVPVLTQYEDYEQQRLQEQRPPLPPPFQEFGDYGQQRYYDESADVGQTHRGTGFAIQQQSFFRPSSFAGSSNSGNGNSHSNGNGITGGGSLVTNNGYGGITPPPPLEPPISIAAIRNQVVGDNVNQFGINNVVNVPSSLRELEESYIRSLSGTSASFTSDPYSENLEPSSSPGVESYSSFIASRRLNKIGDSNNNNDNNNNNLQSSSRQDSNELSQATQSAPIAYGIPINQQLSATNSIEGLIRLKQHQSGKYYDYPHKNVVSHYPEYLSSRPPIPQEPDLAPIEDDVEHFSRRPSIIEIPTPENSGVSTDPPLPLTSPDTFDPGFPKPALQRGFIPSFGPPTKEPFHEPESNHLPLTSPSGRELPNTSPLPVLRPDYGEISDNLENLLPEGISSPDHDTIYKHISVHGPPEDLEDDISAPPEVVKIPKKSKHVKFIFVRQPEVQQKPEVEVAPSSPQNTLVYRYVLSDRGGVKTPKLVKPTIPTPTPPQVYFVRWKPPAPTKSSSSFDPDAEILRSSPFPVVPTFSSYSNTNSLYSTPTVFTTASSNLDGSNSLDSNNGKYHSLNGQSTSAILRPPNPHLTELHVYQSSTGSPQQNAYTSPLHLYSAPKQNLVYFQSATSKQHQPPFQIFKPGTVTSVPLNEPSTSFQGLYSVASNYKHLGKNLSRPTRNYVMMSYAPTYMPSASGSENVPVFSPAELIKSLLGDTYEFVGNNTLVLKSRQKESNNNNTSEIQHNFPQSGVAVFNPISSETLGTQGGASNTPPSQASHQQSLPLFLNLDNLQNLTRNAHLHPHLQNGQPFTIVIRSSHGIEENARFHHQKEEEKKKHQEQQQKLLLQQRQVNKAYPTVAVPPPVRFNPYKEAITPQPSPFSSSSPRPVTSSTILPRASWTPSTHSPTPPPSRTPSTSTTTRRTQIIQLPIIIYEGSKGKESYNIPSDNLTAGVTVSSFDNLYHIFKHSILKNPANKPLSMSYNNTDYASNEQSSELNNSSSQSESDSDEVGLKQQSSSTESQEEVTAMLFESTKGNSSANHRDHNKSGQHSVSGSLKQAGDVPKNRKRVNPALVKPGRRLRKVRKPNKNRKNKRENDADNNGDNSAGNIDKPETENPAAVEEGQHVQ